MVVLQHRMIKKATKGLAYHGRDPLRLCVLALSKKDSVNLCESSPCSL